jgi:hypothetical protein
MTVLHCIDAIDKGFLSVTDKKRSPSFPSFGGRLAITDYEYLTGWT